MADGNGAIPRCLEARKKEKYDEKKLEWSAATRSGSS